MTLQDIIKEYLTRYNITGRTFAKKCGDRISYPYIANIIRGYSPSTGEPPKVSDDKLEIIAHGMDMTLEQLRAKMRDEKPIFLHQPPGPISLAPLADKLFPSNMETFTYAPGRSMVPIVGSVRCGVGGLAYQDMQGSEVADVADPWHYFYLRVEGDSMAPAIEAGDLALVRIQPDIENGQLAVVIIDGEEGVLKKFKQEGNMVVLLSFNPSFEPRVFVGEEISRIKIAGRVMETKKKW